MKQQQAIHILMLSPFYWLLDPPARKELVHEYCANYEKLSGKCDEEMDKKERTPHLLMTT